jgi:glutathione synthase/RimK-type ligase-like ATP-grasp enzyme
LAAAVPNFINDVGASRRASHKVSQLDAARRVGLRVPATLITNCPEAARQFASSLKDGCVYKTFTGCDFGFFETRKLESAEDFAELALIEECPLIFQEHVSGDFDVRATVVGDEVFAAEIHFKHGRHPVDGRVDRVPIREHRFPADVALRIARLVRDYGLTYGAVDLRFDSSAGYSFFELNPEGQFLWVEIEAGLGICDALARRLLGINGSRWK